MFELFESSSVFITKTKTKTKAKTKLKIKIKRFRNNSFDLTSHKTVNNVIDENDNDNENEFEISCIPATAHDTPKSTPINTPNLTPRVSCSNPLGKQPHSNSNNIKDLAIQIEDIEEIPIATHPHPAEFEMAEMKYDHDTDSLKPMRLIKVPSHSRKSYSCSNLKEFELTDKYKRSLSPITRSRDKYYQKQQASGIEFVSRYTVLIIFASLSSLLLICLLIYEQQLNFNNFIQNIDDIIQLHLIFTIDCIVNCVVSYYYFVFGRCLYRLSCSLCHLSVQKCCLNCCI